VPARVQTDTMIVLAHSMAPTSTRLTAAGPIEPCLRLSELLKAIRSRPPHRRGSSDLEPNHVCRIPTITASHQPTLPGITTAAATHRDNPLASPAWAASTRAAVKDAAAATPKKRSAR